eukprot:5106185-Prymnesium_polylepis.1
MNIGACHGKASTAAPAGTCWARRSTAYATRALSSGTGRSSVRPRGNTFPPTRAYPLPASRRSPLPQQVPYPSM